MQHKYLKHINNFSEQYSSKLIQKRINEKAKFLHSNSALFKQF